MATRPRPTSRQPARRPRKVATRIPEPVVEPEATEPPVTEPPATEPTLGAAEAPAPSAYTRLDEDPGEPPHHGLLDRMSTLVALVVALVVLLGAGVWLAHYVWFSPEPRVTAQRPVVTGEIAHRAGVEAASQDVGDILSYGYQDFDQQIADAQKMMTPGFAAKFKQTAGDVRERFLKGRTTQEVKVVGAGVVRASDSQVQALLFLDSFVTHGKAASDSTYTPYRALVTMVHTEHGWLVDNIETR